VNPTQKPRLGYNDLVCVLDDWPARFGLPDDRAEPIKQVGFPAQVQAVAASDYFTRDLAPLAGAFSFWQGPHSGTAVAR